MRVYVKLSLLYNTHINTKKMSNLYYNIDILLLVIRFLHMYIAINILNLLNGFYK